MRSINAKTKNLSWYCTNCNAIGNDFNALKEVILKLQDELRELKCNYSNKVASNYEFEDFMQEFEDRQKRRSNVIIFGVAEQSSDLDRNTRQNEEKSTVIGILNEISPETILDENSKIIRLGKFNATSHKPRPIRLRLENEQMVHNIIHKFSSVKKNSNFKHLSISFDRTPKQLEHFKAMKMELENRQKSGEHNLKIKFIRGSPKIISLNQTRPAALST